MTPLYAINFDTRLGDRVTENHPEHDVIVNACDLWDRLKDTVLEWTEGEYRVVNMTVRAMHADYTWTDATQDVAEELFWHLICETHHQHPSHDFPTPELFENVLPERTRARILSDSRRDEAAA